MIQPTFKHTIRLVVLFEGEEHAISPSVVYVKYDAVPAVKEAGLVMLPAEPAEIEILRLEWEKTELPLELLSKQQIYSLEQELLSL